MNIFQTLCTLWIFKYMKIPGTILVASHDERLDGMRVASWSPLTPRGCTSTMREKAKKRRDRAWPFSLKTLRGTRRKRAFFCCHRQQRASGIMVDALSRYKLARGGWGGKQTGNTCRYKLPRCVTSKRGRVLRLPSSSPSEFHTLPSRVSYIYVLLFPVK